MSLVPHFEIVTKNSTISHFLLMLGLKLFSFYFPLFLLERGLSLPRVGFVYLLIYLPMAVSSPFMGAISRKINPFFLVISGIFGYGLYSLGMLILPLSLFFYILQVVLGISASLFFVGNRIILMSSQLSKPARSFGWFYSAPYYAAGFAPVIGAGIIFLWGFNGIFILSVLIHAINLFFTFFSMPKNLNIQAAADSYVDSLSHFYQVVKKSFSFNVFPILVFSLVVLILGGFYQSFFLIFLKSIGWGRTEILTYSSLFSILFLPLSLYGIRILSGQNIAKTIFIGGALFAVSSVAIGLTASFVGFIGILIVMLVGEFGSFLLNSSRSGFISKAFSPFPHGAAVLDTVFSPLGTAIGALLGGLLVGFIGYTGIFIFGGTLILLLAILLGIRLTFEVNPDKISSL
ncbi:MAG: MFS transporter [Candidatus Levybacteria bacterium]|nr:MFS transporter [Candidatus Levybacteria bacterium]MDZ4228455.1 MFS transporter [Candidatus Levybacteria bacterium]